MNLDIHSEKTGGRLKILEEGLKYIIDLDLFDSFYDEIWSKEIAKLQDKYFDKNSYYELSQEEINDIKQHVVEWFGDDYGLAMINGKSWMVSVGSVDEGGNKWWYKIKINSDDLNVARKVILLDKCLPGKYCNVLYTD